MGGGKRTGTLLVAHGALTPRNSSTAWSSRRGNPSSACSMERAVYKMVPRPDPYRSDHAQDPTGWSWRSKASADRVVEKNRAAGGGLEARSELTPMVWKRHRACRCPADKNRARRRPGRDPGRRRDMYGPRSRNSRSVASSGPSGDRSGPPSRHTDSAGSRGGGRGMGAFYTGVTTSADEEKRPQAPVSKP